MIKKNKKKTKRYVKLNALIRALDFEERLWGPHGLHTFVKSSVLKIAKYHGGGLWMLDLRVPVRDRD